MVAMHGDSISKVEKLYFDKILRRLDEIRERFLLLDREPIPDVAMAQTMAHLSLLQAKRLPYSSVRDGLRWGKPWGTAWFRVRFRIPTRYCGRTIVFRFRIGGECIIYRDGEPVQALDRGRDEYVLFENARGGERVELYVEAGANSDFGRFEIRTMHQPEMGIRFPEVWAAYWDLEALAEMVDPHEKKDWFGRPMHALNPDDTRRAKIFYVLNKAVDVFSYGNPTLDELRLQAQRVRRMLKPLFACRAHASAQTSASMGHAHIDVAWLWPLAETIRKCGRTFSNVLALMDQYPEIVFAQSQPQLYEYTRDRYPALYRRIRQRVGEGRWCPTGCMWVEPDTNIPSGESLVRQILFGTRFFEKEFNVRPRSLWLPDVFGYSAALPQILKRSGVDYFLTIKISWNQFTRFPHHSFWWEGIDGSRVLAHFPPADSYNCLVTASQILTAERNYRQKDRCSIQAMLYGLGDGGGGPTAEMLERLRRYRDLEGMPKLQPMSPEDFFKHLESQAAELPIWVGELYPELHRGTYTTRARNKKFNRQCEVLLREAEILSSFVLSEGGRYPQQALNECWKLLLLNQFHDILPGSSIDAVYADSDRHYATILKQASRIRETALRQLAAKVDTRGIGVPIVAINSLSWERRGIIGTELRGLRRNKYYVALAPDGNTTPVQLCSDGVARFIGTVPALGYRVFHIRTGKPSSAAVLASPNRMENDLLRVDFDRNGRLTRVLDKRISRDVLAAGAVGNQFVIYEDKPVNWPAWDIDIFHEDKPLEQGGELISAEVVEQGAVRAVLRQRRRISRSEITQDVILTHGSARLDFVTAIAWGEEKDVLLKVLFPVNVRADRARYEIQFGNVERPTHRNRTHDQAQFEVVAHRWVDLAETDYGVALLNDGKYGHSVHGNVMKLTPLRAPREPGKTPDVNLTHNFTYALFPHPGSYVNGVVRAGYELNARARLSQPERGRVRSRQRYPGSRFRAKTSLWIL